MFLNSRLKSFEHLSLTALGRRTELMEEEILQFTRVQRGYSGECLYDKIFSEVGHDEVLIYRDLYLKIGESVTQYDALIINDNGVTVNEIKNYSGEYRYEGVEWYRGKYQVPDDPLAQLTRAVGKLKRLRDSARGRFDVRGRIIFPNDDFYLVSDDSKIWDKVVVRLGLKRYLRQFKGGNLTKNAKFISNLIGACEVENPYFKPDIDPGRLKAGLYCGSCGSFELDKGRFHLKCLGCGSRESNETHLIRAMSDYKYLFYGQPMSRHDLMKFIGYEISSRAVYKYLLKYCDVQKSGNKTTYRFKYYDFDEAMQQLDAHLKYKDHLN